MKIGYLGPEGTFSHQAASKFFLKEDLFPFSEIKEIFEAIKKGEIDYGIVPAENAIGGIIFEVIYNLINHPTKVIGSFEIPISHCLLAKKGDIKDLKIIRTHVQALVQCRNWIEKNLKDIELQIVSSTAKPVLEEKEGIGFIGSKELAEKYNLKILAEKIEDIKGNSTKFYVISSYLDSSIRNLLNPKRTLLVFAVYDRVGILRDVLDVFAKYRLNLTALHSIPTRVKPFDYFFFTEIDKLWPSEELKNAFREINKKYCPLVKLIGIN